MEQWKTLKDFVEKNRDMVFETVRIYLGLGLFAKGVYFVSHIGSVLSLLDNGLLGVQNIILAHGIAFAHLGGGLLVAAGLLTRVAAAVQVPILVGAVLTLHIREGLFGSSQNLEFSLLVLFLLVLTTIHGGGRLSADHYLAKDISPQPRTV